ncbi:MAG TPA: nitrate reductase [Rhodospirillaceae bacterium]|nr:nitrate reductase [Rhodospirillaceae bacterium]HCS68635.1 nitrate reductase [Rhodospirillaceae bacterium]
MTDGTAKPESSCTATTCPYCGVGCGVQATVGADGTVVIAGDPDHPANFGRLCSKGTNLGETLSRDDRLLHPEIGGRPASWDDALDLVASRFREAIDEHGPDSVAFYVSGQLLTEDYYVANKLMKGFIGSGNIDTNSRLCMASSVAGHKRAFGTDTVPGLYEDLEQADLVVMVGSNLAWCHPVLYQRLQAARKERGTRVVVIDPRRTATAETADMHLALRPGSDVALFNGLLAWLAQTGGFDGTFIADHTAGVTAALRTAETADPEWVAARCGLPLDQVLAFYKMFVRTERTVTVYSQGVNQSSAGTDKVNAIINCHLATGRIGRPGMGPFSVTGQPNAMGGRETGGLANQLACHLELDDPSHRDLVQGFWASPVIAGAAGLKAVDMFDAVADGRIKALWIMATNPAVSLPDADRVRDAIRQCPFVAVSDVTRATDTAALAHVLLPAQAWGEKEGTVTNSERRISRQRAFLPIPDDVRADWWMISQVAARLGHGDAFDYAGPADIFREYAALTVRANAALARDLDLGAMAAIDDGAYDALPPTLWPQRAEGVSEDRFFADGGFFTADGRGRFIAVTDRAPATAADIAYPLVLNTGRIRDQWHTMTRTGLSPALSQHLAEPFLEIAPEDAERLDLGPAMLARVTSPQGECLVRALITRRVKPGQVFMPMHWNDQWSGRARADALVASHVDPVSGQPEAKYTPVCVTPFAAGFYGFAVTNRRPDPAGADYWALARAEGGWRLELAGAAVPGDWAAWAASILGLDVPDDTLRVMASEDRAAGGYRMAAFRGDDLVGALFAAKDPVAVDRAWLTGKLTENVATLPERIAILAGRRAADKNDPGAIVCTCMFVGANDIRRAILDQGCTTVDAVGACTGAGITCGSCRPEIEVLIADAELREAS